MLNRFFSRDRRRDDEKIIFCGHLYRKESDEFLIAHGHISGVQSAG
jgi:hypothetical protein